MQPSRAYSPALLAKAYLAAMGVEPILSRQPDFPADVLGWATSAFYGGPAECRIRRTVVPVELVDFTSMYPTVDALMGLWGLLTAARDEAVDVTTEVQTLLDGLGLRDCFDPGTWPQLVGIAEVVPDGEVYPVRAVYGHQPDWNIGVNHLHGRSPLGEQVPMWFTIADLAAATLLTGQTPTILGAVRFAGHGKLPGLQRVKLRGEITIDPRRKDFFRAVIEQRHRLDDKTSPLGAFLKVLPNAGSYGIFAEMNRQDLPKGDIAEVIVHGRHNQAWTARVGAPVMPGPFCFPPIAACITGAARLMLAMLERCVTDLGGAWAFCDTDSMAMVANDHGGLVACPGGPHRLDDGTEAVRALSYAEVDAIGDRFAALNPYDRKVFAGHDLEIRGPGIVVGDLRQTLRPLPPRRGRPAGSSMASTSPSTASATSSTPKRWPKGWSWQPTTKTPTTRKVTRPRTGPAQRSLGWAGPGNG